MDWTLELVTLPVTDVDRAKNFYTSIGFNADHDHTVTEDLRFVQLAVIRQDQVGLVADEQASGHVHAHPDELIQFSKQRCGIDNNAVTEDLRFVQITPPV